MRRPFLLDVDNDTEEVPLVYVALTHDNRFMGVFGSPSEAASAATLPGAFVSAESLNLARHGGNDDDR